MKPFSTILLLAAVTLMLSVSCTNQYPREKSLKYPRKQASSSERKSGPAMSLYEAAEDDADPNNVIVIPPSDKKRLAD